MQPIDQLTYDGFNFADNGLVITNLNYMNLPQRKNQIASRANRDGGVLVQSLLDIKSIPIEGFYKGESKTDAENMYDTLAAVLNRQARPLIVAHAGSTRTFIATPE